MGRNFDPKCKQCRRETKKLFLKGERCFSQKCAIVKRNYLPGVHGPNARVKLSDYGVHLREKQKVKRMYRLLERQFRNYFDRALKQSAQTGENLLAYLEGRFDNVIYRAGFASSRDQARQLISHGHFLVNGRKLNVPSYHMKVGDTITVQEKSQSAAAFKELQNRLEKFEAPGWLSVEAKEYEIKIIAIPVLEELAKEVDVNLIVEFYSK